MAWQDRGMLIGMIYLTGGKKACREQLQGYWDLREGKNNPESYDKIFADSFWGAKSVDEALAIVEEKAKQLK